MERTKMSKEELKILEKQLSHFIKWLADNRPYKEGLLYGDMKDYLARLNQKKMKKINPPYKFDDIRPKENYWKKINEKPTKFIEMFDKYIKLPK